MAQVAASGGPPSGTIEAIIAKHHAAQLMLEPLMVRIPFAAFIQIDISLVSSRRIYGQFQRLIEAVAVLRQKQKPAPVNGFIDADLADYRLARELFVPCLQAAFSPLPKGAQLLLEAMASLPGHHRFKVRELVSLVGLCDTAVRNRLKVLVDAGLVVPGERQPGQLATHYAVVSNNPLAATASGLPTVEQLAELINSTTSSTGDPANV